MVAPALKAQRWPQLAMIVSMKMEPLYHPELGDGISSELVDTRSIELADSRSQGGFK